MHADSMHRLVKILIDSGEAASVDDAFDTFSRYGLRIRLPREIAYDPGQQIIALTAINCASRSFQGNVLVESDDFELSVPGFQGTRLESFLQWARVKPSLPAESACWPRIVVNGERVERGDIVVWSSGWDFGIGTIPRISKSLFVPACVAAAGLGISEAFSVLRSDNAYAGRREVSLSLWNPESAKYLPLSPIEIPAQEGLWLIGAGHLGQSYAWALGFMKAGSRPVFLQDIDVVSTSTLSTSMLSTASDVGQTKTRVVARWLEARGYQTAVIERRFDENQRVRSEEPSTALFGVDNAAARRVIESAGFRVAIDGGLGSGRNDFRGIRVRTFPGSSDAATLWATEPETRPPSTPAYERLLKSGSEACGITLLATRAVGAPFVGCVAAGYVLAERIRRQLDGPKFSFIDMNLREPHLVELG